MFYLVSLDPSSTEPSTHFHVPFFSLSFRPIQKLSLKELMNFCNSTQSQQNYENVGSCDRSNPTEHSALNAI